MSKRSKACEISKEVKLKVYERDKHICVVCGKYVTWHNSCCHYISRAGTYEGSGLGIEENILTLCNNCHYRYDNTSLRPVLKEYLKNYLKSKYDNWNEENLVYNKWRN